MIFLYPGFIGLVETNLGLSIPYIIQIVLFGAAFIAASKDITIGYIVQLVFSALSIIVYYNLEWNYVIPVLLLFASTVGLSLSLYSAYRQGEGVV